MRRISSSGLAVALLLSGCSKKEEPAAPPAPPQPAAAAPAVPAVAEKPPVVPATPPPASAPVAPKAPTPEVVAVKPPPAPATNPPAVVVPAAPAPAAPAPSPTLTATAVALATTLATNASPGAQKVVETVQQVVSALPTNAASLPASAAAVAASLLANSSSSGQKSVQAIQQAAATPAVKVAAAPVDTKTLTSTLVTNSSPNAQKTLQSIQQAATLTTNKAPDAGAVGAALATALSANTSPTAQKSLQAAQQGVATATPEKLAVAKNSLPVSNPAATSAPPATAATLKGLAGLSQDQVTLGLKEALGKGLEQAVASLGKSGGFLTNAAVKIPMPEKLLAVEQTLRKLGQDRLADDFIVTMNHAAEQAVPAAAEVFTAGLKRMTVEDAKQILGGTTNAATEYFRKTSGAELKQKFFPIVQKATAASGATAAYKQLLDRARLASPFLTAQAPDLDGYVSDKAMDGLFKMVAAEESRIRANPAARGTELLQSVFGALPSLR